MHVLLFKNFFMQKLYFTYILLCSDDSYYTGITNNVFRRLQEHNSDEEKRSYCHKRRPVKLMFTKAFLNVKEAISYEKQIKRWSRKKKEALILSDFNKLHELAACQNDSHFQNIVRLRSL